MSDIAFDGLFAAVVTMGTGALGLLGLVVQPWVFFWVHQRRAGGANRRSVRALGLGALGPLLACVIALAFALAQENHWISPQIADGLFFAPPLAALSSWVGITIFAAKRLH